MLEVVITHTKKDCRPVDSTKTDVPETNENYQLFYLWIGVFYNNTHWICKRWQSGHIFALFFLYTCFLLGQRNLHCASVDISDNVRGIRMEVNRDGVAQWEWITWRGISVNACRDEEWPSTSSSHVTQLQTDGVGKGASFFKSSVRVTPPGPQFFLSCLLCSLPLMIYCAILRFDAILTPKSSTPYKILRFTTQIS